MAEAAQWVSAAATLAAVVVAYVIALQDRRRAAREARERWEIDAAIELAGSSPVEWWCRASDLVAWPVACGSDQ
jgi:hypothetical protein